jgi:undecaprenyl-phosphate 4-deoxy-4-formamido-L-arabinose transferase
MVHTQNTNNQIQDYTLISIIMPCYKSAEHLQAVVYEIRAQFVAHLNFAYQIILVCDGSPDNTFDVIRGLCKEDPCIVGLNLSRNFSQQSARMAAMPYAKGKYIVFMDDDGQHPPEGIFPLISKLEEGFDIVYAAFPQKKHGLIKKLGSALNAATASMFYGKPKEVQTASFFAATDFVVRNMLAYVSPNPYTLGYFLQVTRNICSIPITHRERLSGKSNYTFFKMVKLYLYGLTSFSTVPLRITSLLGAVTSGFGFLWGAHLIFRKLLNPDVEVGYTSLMSAILFVGGVIMLMWGILGEYVARIFAAINHIPQYIIREEINVSTDIKDVLR